MANNVVGFTGARNLNPAQLAQVSSLAATVAQSGGIIHTGCASGADAAAGYTATCAGGSVHVFAAGNAIGQGFPNTRAPLPLQLVTASRVTWLAGGPLTVPLVARLAKRSLAMVRTVAAAGGSLVAFPAYKAPPPRPFGPGPFPSCGSGTWSTVAAAVLQNVPVFVFLPAAPAVVLPVAGSWSASSFFGCQCWAFVPAAARLF